MLHFFAVDPGLVPAWSQRAALRFWRTQFLPGERRAIAAYPTIKAWKKLIREEIRHLTPEVDGDTRAMLLAELTKVLTEQAVVIERGDTPAADGSWLTNAVRAHRLRPMAGILTHRDDFSDPGITIQATEVPPDSPLWELEPSGPVERSDAATLERIRPLLDNAKYIRFIDPYFDFHQPRFTEPMLSRLRAISSRGGGRPILVEIVLAERDATPTTASVTAATHKVRCFSPRQGQVRDFSSQVPANLSVQVRVLSETDGSDALHDRFVLTDIGGIQFTVGLDVVKTKKFDGAHLLDRAHLEHYNNYYVNPCKFKQTGQWWIGAARP